MGNEFPCTVYHAFGMATSNVLHGGAQRGGHLIHKIHEHNAIGAFAM